MANLKESEVIQSLSHELIDQFRAIVGEQFIIVDEEQRTEYGHDKTEDYLFLPDLVIKPGTPEEVSAILKVCNQYKVPVTPRGAGTGLAGA